MVPSFILFTQLKLGIPLVFIFHFWDFPYSIESQFALSLVEIHQLTYWTAPKIVMVASYDAAVPRP